MRRLVPAFAVLILCAFGSPPASAGGFDFVTGEHKAHLQVAFTAHDSPKGPTGQIKLQFEAGMTIHVAVDCLKVNGNLASLEGNVVRSNHPDVPGGRIEVEVEDKGEASPGHQRGPDELQVNFTYYPRDWTPGIGPDCQPNSDPFNRTVDGNVEVHDAP